MDIHVRDTAALRELLGEPVSQEQDDASRQRPVYRQLSVQFYPYAAGTAWTVITTDRQGHRRWQRTVATGQLSTTIHELHGRELAEVLQLLLRDALENLS